MFFFSKAAPVARQTGHYADVAAHYLYAVGGTILGVFSMQNLVRFLALRVAIDGVSGSPTLPIDGNVYSFPRGMEGIMEPYADRGTLMTRQFECNVTTEYQGMHGIKTTSFSPGACLSPGTICETSPDDRCENVTNGFELGAIVTNKNPLRLTYPPSNASSCWYSPQFGIQNQGCTWQDVECEIEPYSDVIDVSCLYTQ